MIRKRVLHFFAVFCFFGSALAFLHYFLLISVNPGTGNVINEAPLVGSLALFLGVLAFILLVLAARRLIPTKVPPRIYLHNVKRELVR